MTCTKQHCSGCKCFVSLSTIRHHLKHGCNRQQQQHSCLVAAANAIIEHALNKGCVCLDPNPQPPTRLSCHYGWREPPRSLPPPALRDCLACPPNDPLAELPQYSPEVAHLDFCHDTFGVGPVDKDDKGAQYTLRNAFPWLDNLNAKEYLVNKFLLQLVRTGDHKLPDHQRLLVQAFNLKVLTDISGISYSKLRRAFPNQLGNLPTESKLQTCIGVISGLHGSGVNCCVNLCAAYTGAYANEVICLCCSETRYQPNPCRPDCHIPRWQFQYIPLVPRLIAYYQNPLMACSMQYCLERQRSLDLLSDIFDGSFYRQLLGCCVTVGAETLDHHYFSKPTDVALGLSTDSFGPFKSRKQTCWPLILFNYNLPPLICMQLQHILCIGVIPGSNAPKELTTYLKPLITKLEDLACSIPAFDVVDGHTFSLRTYLLTAFGDMPAMAKLMSMKGPNSKFPCCACKIEGVNQGGAGCGKNTLYVPLSQPFVPRAKIQRYDPLNLPCCSHANHVQQALNVQGAVNDPAEQVLSCNTGVNGLLPLARLALLEFPTLFPHDFMHVMFENILPTLIGLWTRRGQWSTFGSNNKDYQLLDEVWTAVGVACADSGDTIPAAFGCHIPNLDTKPQETTSESMLLFATLIGPALLHCRFVRPCYYHHFVWLVKLIKLCIGLDVRRVDVDEIWQGFAQWVQDYKRYYYQDNRTRLPACTLPLHALLHIANNIEAMGPVWCYWAFPMEHINQHVLQLSQLSQIKHLYGLAEELDLKMRQENIATGTCYNAYKDLVFVKPRRERSIQGPLIRKVAEFISTQIPGKMQQITRNEAGNVTGRDLIWGDHIVANNCKLRDALHVMYWSVNSHWLSWTESHDQYKWLHAGPSPNLGGGRCPAVVLDKETFGYGCAEQFLVIDAAFLWHITKCAGVFYPHLDDLVLAVVSPIPYLRHIASSGITQYSLRGGRYVSPEILDASKIDCLVGRVQLPLGALYIVQRDTAVGQLDMLDEVVNPN
ncbi:Transposase family tnp2 [Rhizoctonia solani]|uniref:Transposase family tnp2 n=1 Tax=Rhizoctonia solani TaxID=456999 RepID=A0A8H7GYC4_9AGAM|nr:Transposase family tnp2 [Rhizoctonia solani]